MAEGIKKVITDLVLLVSNTGHYQEFETGAVSDLLMHKGNKPHLRMLLPDKIADMLIETVTGAIDKGVVHMVNYSLGIGAKGEYFEARAIPLHLNYALLLIQNETANVENRKELRRQNSLLQTVIDTIPTEITAFDNTGNVTLTNKSALKQQNQATDTVETEILQLQEDGITEFQPDELPLIRAFNGESVYNHIVIKKGEAYFPKTYLVNAIPLKDEAGNVSSVVLAERDITNVKNIKHKLRSKIKDFDMFMYRASHDLKSPLASMKGVLDFALPQTTDPDAKKFLQMISKSHKLLTTTVNDLIDLTRISQKEIEKKTIALYTFLHDITDALRLLHQAENIKIRVCAQESIKITADEGLLQAVMQNLICNAILHHYPDGEDRFVLVTVVDQPYNVLIEVSDNGPGIPKNIQDKIYDIFYRGNMNTAGSGLGLFIVKQAIEKMGASIELASDEQAGTTFSVILPKY